MQHFLGFSSLIIIFLFIIYYTSNRQNLKNFLIISFIVRAITLIANEFNLINFPDSNSDTDYFYEKAIEYSRINGLSIIFDILTLDNLFYPKFISIFFSVFGESRMMAQSIGVAFGTACVYLVYSLSLVLWDDGAAKKAAWVAAFFPSLILYSCLMLREVYFVFFLLFALNAIFNLMTKKSLTSFINITLSFFFITHLHGPGIIGGFIFFIFLFFTNINQQLVKLFHFKINIYFISIIFFSTIPFILYSKNYYQIPYFGHFDSLLDSQFLLEKINRGFFDSASYPDFLKIESIHEFYYKFIIKIFYFLYSPFIWDIKKITHLFGLLDATLYILLTICIIKNFKEIWKHPIAKIFIMILVVYLLIYAFGAGNFGISFRHRSKFVVMFIILSAPKLAKFVFQRKKNNR